MFRFGDAYYMIYSRWEKDKGFSAWVSDSKVCLARPETAEGRFRHVKTLFDYAGNTPEERRVIHNPAAIVVKGRVYLLMTLAPARVRTTGSLQAVKVCFRPCVCGELRKRTERSHSPNESNVLFRFSSTLFASLSCFLRADATCPGLV